MSDPCQSERDAVENVESKIRDREDFLAGGDAPPDSVPKIRAEIKQLQARKAFLVSQLDKCVATHTPAPPIKCVAVKLAGIVCESNGFGGTASLVGSVFGVVIEKQTGNTVSRTDIFPFPSGPLTVKQGQTLPIQMDDSVVFCGPSTRLLRVGGELNLNLGSNFVDVDFFEHFPAEPPAVRSVEFKTTNLTVALQFEVRAQTPS